MFVNEKEGEQTTIKNRIQTKRNVYTATHTVSQTDEQQARLTSRVYIWVVDWSGEFDPRRLKRVTLRNLNGKRKKKRVEKVNYCAQEQCS